MLLSLNLRDKYRTWKRTINACPTPLSSRVGVSLGQFYDEHLQFIRLNEVCVCVCVCVCVSVPLFHYSR